MSSRQITAGAAGFLPCPEHGEQLVVLPSPLGDGLVAAVCPHPGCQCSGYSARTGMEPRDIEPHLGPRVGIFVGGDTDWKLDTLPAWGDLARRVGCHLHVGRVNTRRRIWHCALAGAHSFDGSSVSRYACNLPGLDEERRQGILWSPA